MYVLCISQSFGSRVIGLRRRRVQDDEDDDSDSVAFLDEVYVRSDLSKFLSGCDYVCSVLPKTPETNDIIGKDVLETCKGE